MNIITNYYAELTHLFYQLDHTENQSDIFKKIFTIIETLHLENQCSINDRRPLRANLMPNFSSSAYPASAFISAEAGLKNPYFRVYGLEIPQDQQLTDASRTLKTSFEKYRQLSKADTELFTQFEQNWNQFETLFMQSLKKSLDTAKKCFQSIGKAPNPEDFIKNLSRVTSTRLTLKTCREIKQISASHVLKPLAMIALNSLKDLKEAFNTFSKPFNREFPAQLREKMQEVESLFAQFDQISNEPVTQKFLQKMIGIVQSNPQIDCTEELATFEVPCLALFELWEDCSEEERVSFFGTEKLDYSETSLIKDKPIPKDFIQRAWKMHSEMAQRLSLFLQIASNP